MNVCILFFEKLKIPVKWAHNGILTFREGKNYFYIDHSSWQDLIGTENNLLFQTIRYKCKNDINT